jgi:putative transport protein
MHLDLIALLQKNMEMSLFIIIGVGYLVGRIGGWGIQLGSSIGVLFIALYFGHLGFTMSPLIGTVGFVFFIYSVGYQAGPDFFPTFREEGVRYIQIGLVIVVTAFGTVVLGAAIFDMEPGFAAGVLAGGLTSTPTLAAAQASIESGLAKIPAGITEAEVGRNIAVGYAVTYVFGLIGLILFLQFVPKILGFDLHREAVSFAENMKTDMKDADDEMGLGSKGMPSTRIYEITKAETIGKCLDDLKFLQATGAVMARLRRGGEDVSLGPDTVLEEGDRALVLGYNENQVKAANILGKEILDPDLDRTVFATHIIVVSSQNAASKTLRDTGVTNRFACVTHSVTRGGIDLPVSLDMIIQRGDLLIVSGPQANLDRLVLHLGHKEKPVHETDLLTFAFGIVAGLFVGKVTVDVGIPLGIGSAGGLLVAGLIVGWVHGRNPMFGRVPAAARFILMELGLLLFLAGVGLRAGSGLVEGLLSAGPALFVTGVFVTLVPATAGVIYGKYVLKINPAVLLGAMCGGLTSTPALGVITKQAKSDVPAIGYVCVYAFANIILTIAGQLIMM